MEAYNFGSVAKVLESAEPTVYNGAWKVIKGGLLESGEIAESAGVVQKVVSIQTAATETATTGETLSALCAMEVTEAEVAGATVTTLTPKAAITFTPKTVALCGIAGALGLDFGFRIGQNLVNLYFGDDWDWHAQGIFDKAKDAIRTYINADGTTYYDEETINAFANRLNEIGAFSSGFTPGEVKRGEKLHFGGINLATPDNFSNVKNIDIAISQCIDRIKSEFNYNVDIGKDLIYNEYYRSGNYCMIHFYDYTAGDYYISNETSDKDILDFNNSLLKNNGISSTGSTIDLGIITSNAGYLYEAIIQSKDLGSSWTVSGWSKNPSTYTITLSFYGNEDYYFYNIGSMGSSIDGVTEQDGAVVPSNFPLEIPETYPTWQPSPLNKPDGANQTYPVEMPDTDPFADKATKPQNEAQKGLNTDADTNKDIENAINKAPQVSEDMGLDPNPSAPTDDIGDLPITQIPALGIQGTGFVALYNPTQAQLASFSQYLWSNNFIDNIKKLFEDPMQAIIGLHMIYATPSRGDDHNIICGYLDSGVNSRTVSSQYINIDCGAIKINKYFGNILDYSPYTKIQLFLPFIGVVNIDTNEVMDSTLNITYRVDVLTGACLAQVYVSRSDYGAVIYTFSGNCAVQLPITGGNYSSIIANTIGIGASIGATIASGGALAPVAVAGVAAGVSNSHLNVAHSGSIGSNAGAMGGKIPYLIITRPKPYNADNYNNFYGYPSNNTIKLSSCNGYTRVKDIHLENISSATDEELNEIESLLKEGVII